jgi:hypothetical protein
MLEAVPAPPFPAVFPELLDNENFSVLPIW